jgi:two-component system chemotaxis response regulator CheB
MIRAMAGPGATRHEPGAGSQRPASHFDVVAIGASAGGVEALMSLIAALPAALPVAILVVLHLHPRHESLLAQVLARHAQLPVQQATHGVAIAPGNVFIAAPDEHLLVAGGRLALSHADLVHSTRPSVDLLFESVAEEYGPRAIAVVLTGFGVDGARGLRAIKRRGGTTIVQDPGSAFQRSMPDAAVATGAVDLILPLGHIAAALVQLVDLGGWDVARRVP